jgi:hypothetical protein
MVTAARAAGHRRPRVGHGGLGAGGETAGHRAVLRLSWLLLVAPPSLVGYLTAGATPVWLLGSFAVPSLLYRAQVPGNLPPPDDFVPVQPAGEVSKRERARAAYVFLVAAGQPVTGASLAEAAQVSPSYGRALVADFQADPTLAGVQTSGPRPTEVVGGAMTATFWRTARAAGQLRAAHDRAVNASAARGPARRPRPWPPTQHPCRQHQRDEQHQRRRPPLGSANL